MPSQSVDKPACHKPVPTQPLPNRPTADGCDGQADGINVGRYPSLAEKFVAFADSGDIPNANKEINLEAKYDTACMMMQIIFFPGLEVKSLPSKGGTLRIMEVVMVGMRTVRGFERTQPTSRFILALQPSQGV